MTGSRESKCEVIFDAAPKAAQRSRRGRVTRHGRGTCAIFVGGFATLALVFAAGAILGHPVLWVGSVLGAGLAVFARSFFRDPPRTVPAENDCVVAPADGKVIEVVPVCGEEFVTSDATRVSIFLSVFDVHVNRTPVAGIVEYLCHRPGTFRNALRRDARETNERQALGVRMADGTAVLVRQIAGVIARRIVCGVTLGDRVPAGFDYGMIRFGSQTEVVVPDRPGRRFRPRVSRGDRVRGGETIIGCWERGGARSPEPGRERQRR